ncbi:MAG: class I SAM-dependent methyltransferase [Dehalococcoidales bacterium]|nr:class I SAM-dependent methyltransferase [Dehalococcoidales bacterium]
MDNYFQHNREMWDEWASLHVDTEFYDVNGFLNGRNTLYALEMEEVSDVKGKSLLHLMCHFGMDTLSWARQGARVTGADFSPKAIEAARKLSRKAGIESEFVCSNLYELPQNLQGEFDIVYTSAGVLCWLPDLKGWADVIAHFLKCGGFFYIMESHPMMNILFTDVPTIDGPEIANSYFHNPEPDIYPSIGSYAGVKTSKTHTSHEWTHSMGDIVNALISTGLKIEFLHEYPKLFFQRMPYMVEDDEGWWHIPGDKVPLLFTLKAMKPE